jgi:hypothetical protein
MADTVAGKDMIGSLSASLFAQIDKSVADQRRKTHLLVSISASVKPQL